MKTKQCYVCGVIHTNNQLEYYEMTTTMSCYRVGYEDICKKCGNQADSFVNYYGKKKPEDLFKLHQFLVGGVLPMRDYSVLVNAGYY